jgi:N,N'-diacetyllegionaminate synthase
MKIIAELCQNHNGNSELLEKMILAAVKSNATHVKIQNIYVKNLTRRPKFEMGVFSNGETLEIKRPFSPEYERLKNLELSDDLIKHFIKRCKDLGVIPLTTCFTRDDVNHCASLGFREIKVASYDCASYQMLRELNANFDHVYVSTGATFNDEIQKCSQIFENSAEKLTLLHCVTKYPTELKDFNLSRMQYLRRFTPNIGLSDHSLVERDGVFATKCAIFLGASTIERHFTILEKDETKDGPVSITPKHLKEIFDFSSKSREEQEQELSFTMRDWKSLLLGDINRILTHEELLNRSYYRGRFASPRYEGNHDHRTMINNWEETPLDV